MVCCFASCSENLANLSLYTIKWSLITEWLTESKDSDGKNFKPEKQWTL